jgi:molybdate transport system regulatory protein
MVAPFVAVASLNIGLQEHNQALTRDVLQYRAVEAKLRVWIVFGKRLKLGDGRARLLELIDERGSLRQAAAAFGMSYRNAWGYLRELEKAAGFTLIERAPGGTLRSGMRLTPEGREFVACYRTFQRRLDRAAARHFDRAFKGRVFRPRKRSPS